MRKFALAILCSLFICATQTARAQRSAPARPAATPPARTQPAKPAPTPQTPVVAPAAKADDCGCETETPPDVLAIVNGVRVTSKEIEEPIKDKVQQLQQSVADARKRELDLQINSVLLEAEARKRGKTSTKLLEEEVINKTPEPTEAEARAFYDQNKARIGAEWSADLKDQITQYLRSQHQDEHAKQFADQLRAAAQVKLNVSAATAPATEAERARIFATVNGSTITSAMVEDTLKPLIANTQ
ncbi:MAG: hypothetical protein QOF61_2897, partial [Acidobacteriota bacterium]|nr:hypothetical protein [Acidobacteriota bacterium]